MISMRFLMKNSLIFLFLRHLLQFLRWLKKTFKKHEKKSARLAGTFSSRASLASLSAPGARDLIVALRAPFFLDLALSAWSYALRIHLRCQSTFQFSKIRFFFSFFTKTTRAFYTGQALLIRRRSNVPHSFRYLCVFSASPTLNAFFWKHNFFNCQLFINNIVATFMLKNRVKNGKKI